MDSITRQLLALVDLGELERGCHPADAARHGAGHALRPTVAQALRHTAPGQVAAAQHRGRPIAVAVLADGRAFAIADRCPHDGGPLSDGFIEGERLVCARHGWEVDPCTGHCPQRPRDVVEARALRHVARR